MAGTTDTAVEIPQYEEASPRPKTGLDILFDRLDQAPLKLDKHGKARSGEDERKYLREVMPQVVSNIVRIIEVHPNLDQSYDDPEFHAKRVSDLKKLMSFLLPQQLSSIIHTRLS